MVEQPDNTSSASKKTIPNIAYPIVKENGEEFASQEEILAQLSGESTGLYIVSHSGYWHGGIHISAVTTPWSALAGNAEHEDKTAFTGKQPIRCMVDGELVAYRVNQSYGKANFGRVTDDYLFSSSFVLVKHRYQAGEKPESGIDFYSLYMHLAPYEAYEAQEESETLYRIEEKSLSIYASQADIKVNILGSLEKNTEILVNNGEAEYTHPTSGRQYKQARLVEDNGQGLTTFWILSDKGTENIAPVNTQTTVAPWLKSLMTPVDENTPEQFGGFDKVVVLDEPIPLKAKDALGHMGLFQIEQNARPTHHYMVHIELLSADENFRNFIESTDKLTDEERNATLKYIKYSKDNPITRYRYDSTTQTMAPYGEKTRSTGILSIERTAKQSIANVVEVVGENAAPATTTYYYSEAERAYLSEHELQTLSQYDFSELGYTLFEDNERIFKKLGWFDRILVQKSDLKFETISHLVVDMLKSFSEFTESNYNQRFNWPEDQQLINSIKQLTNTIESQTHFISPETMLRFLTYPPYLADHYYRFIVKHISEWYVDYDSAPWEKTDIVTKRFNKNFAAGKKSQIEQLIWMKDVPAFNTENPIWHMHPIVFLDGLKRKESKITLKMLRQIWTSTKDVPDALLQKVAEELSDNMEISKIDTSLRLYHFIAQVYQEVGPKFNLNENLNFNSLILKTKFSYYFTRYDEADRDGSNEYGQKANPVVIANKAYGDRYGNGSVASGDGWKYRGRGMKQLTFKNNYSAFTTYHERVWKESIDFVENPDLLLELPYCVRSALFFWESNKLYPIADQGSSKDISLKISNIVNYYDDKKNERFNNLVNFMKKGIFDEIF